MMTMTVVELENLLSDMVRQEPDQTVEVREQLALYLGGLEERIRRLERGLVSTSNLPG